MKKIFLSFVMIMLLTACVGITTEVGVSTHTTGKGISSSVKHTTDASKSSSSNEEEKNWEYDEGSAV